MTLLGQAWDWLGSFFGATEQASLGVDSVTDAGRRLGTVLGAVFEALLTPGSGSSKPFATPST
ncbi:hypothetical protein [Aeromonas salmonicida]|uniref:hypothetical protein n=1 Tax=Aeromonas salmonicida TaxID=645 RepID=UPI000DA0E169|nr:hypothetical protein [Aeromonas salmonicida]SPT64879.1 phage tail length determinator [Aeromonas salmonicida]